MKNTLKENAEALALRTVLGYINGKDPDDAIEKVLEWVDKFDGKEGTVAKQRALIHRELGNKDGNWYRLVKSFWTDIDPSVRERTFENFIINATILGGRRKAEARKKYGCNIPWTILIDPTSACNLHCIGCWAAEYGNHLNLSYEFLDSLVNQANEIGVRMFLYTGGEPLVRKADIIRLCEAHPDSQFMSFTNGTLIDEAFCQEMLRVKNFVPAISLEGFEKANDGRRGDGVYHKVRHAMELMKEHRLPFGISVCYTSQNFEDVSSEAFYDMMIESGALFVWYFHYMPVGHGAVTDLLPTPEQREEMYHRIRHFRGTKAIFGMDFQNDGEYVGGCIAGGRRYLHINAKGDVEPCVFIHYSNVNIHDCSLLDALRSPIFQAYHDNQPFNNNHLRPCPMLENPERLRKLVKDTGAVNTDYQDPESVDDLCDRCRPYAENWKPTADKLWGERHPQN